MMESQEMVTKVAKMLSDKKAIDVNYIDISPKAAFADYILVASGGSDRQVAALVDNVEDLLEPQGVFVKHIEGKGSTGWILMDYGDVIVNIMSQEMRGRYNIEKIWGDCEITTVE